MNNSKLNKSISTTNPLIAPEAKPLLQSMLHTKLDLLQGSQDKTFKLVVALQNRIIDLEETLHGASSGDYEEDIQCIDDDADVPDLDDSSTD